MWNNIDWSHSDLERSRCRRHAREVTKSDHISSSRTRERTAVRDLGRLSNRCDLIESNAISLNEAVTEIFATSNRAWDQIPYIRTFAKSASKSAFGSTIKAIVLIRNDRWSGTQVLWSYGCSVVLGWRWLILASQSREERFWPTIPCEDVNRVFS